MDGDSVRRLRLSRQQLRAPQADSPEGALKNLLAVQSQEFPYARWSLAQRTAGVSAAEVVDAVGDGRILRTHILRPTWHFVHRDDLGWLMSLSAPRLHQGNSGMYRRTGIDVATATRSSSVLAAAVAGGAHRTREQLAAELQRAGFTAKGLELAYLIMHAEISGVLVSGTPLRSAGGALKQTYALFDERVPAAPAVPMDREEALAELARRYFSSRGPATVKDCAAWSGMTMADIRHGLQLALDADPGALEATVIDGVGFYFHPDGTSGTEPGDGGESARVDLIQCYDEYVMGYSTSRHYLGGSAPAFPVENAPIHVVLLDGRMIGSWRHGFSGGRCELDIRTSRTRDPAVRRAMDQAVTRYGEFLGMPAVRL